MFRQTTTAFVVFLTGATILAPHSFSQVSAGFIENRGQVDSQVLYYARGSGATVYLMEEAIVLDLHEWVGNRRPGGTVR